MIAKNVNSILQKMYEAFTKWHKYKTDMLMDCLAQQKLNTVKTVKYSAFIDMFLRLGN